MPEDDTHIFPPDGEPPRSPLQPGSESAASASRPNLDNDPVKAEEPTPRRQATSQPLPSDPLGQADSIPDSDPPPLKPLHRSAAYPESSPVTSSGLSSGDPSIPAPPPASSGEAVTPSTDISSGGPPLPTPPSPKVPAVPGSAAQSLGGAPPGEGGMAPPGEGGHYHGQPPVDAASQAAGVAGAPELPGTEVPSQASSTGASPAPVDDNNVSASDIGQEMKPPETTSYPTQAENVLANEETQKSAIAPAVAKQKATPFSQKEPVPRASQRQPAYHRSPYEKSIEKDKKNKQLLWALAGSSFVLAVVSLLLGLGVLQVRSSQISSSDIAPGAIGEKQIAPGVISEGNLDSKLQKDIFGKTGPRGPAGPKGEKGARGAAGITSLDLVNREVSGGPADSEISGVALCQDGQVAISGGALIAGGKAALSASEPASGFSGWRASALREEGSSGSWRIRIYAVCATPAQGILDSIG